MNFFFGFRFHYIIIIYKSIPYFSFLLTYRSVHKQIKNLLVNEILRVFHHVLWLKNFNQLKLQTFAPLIKLYNKGSVLAEIIN